MKIVQTYIVMVDSGSIQNVSIAHLNGTWLVCLVYQAMKNLWNLRFCDVGQGVMKLMRCVQLCKNRNRLMAKISNIFEAMIVNITPAFTVILDLRVQIIFNVARKHVKIDKNKTCYFLSNLTATLPLIQFRAFLSVFVKENWSVKVPTKKSLVRINQL